jgi:4'-phosphopantetheinyl transferase
MNGPLADDEIGIWYWKTDTLEPHEVDALDAVLSAPERARRDRLVFPRDRRDYTAAHALLRRVLSRCGGRPEADWTFHANSHGKPALPADQAGSPPIAFNLSHTHGLVACAIARGVQVGVDVELVSNRVNALEIGERYFAPSEVRWLRDAGEADRCARFTELWTLKEAYIKAVGSGLGVPLDSFAFGFDGASGLRFSPSETRWRFVLAAPTADSRLAIAVDEAHAAPPRRARILGVGATVLEAAPLDVLRWSPSVIVSSDVVETP